MTLYYAVNDSVYAANVFVTLFSAKWLNYQSPCNYLRGAGKGTASKGLMREYWICTSIRVLIKCGLHKDSGAIALTQLPQYAMGGETAGRRGGQWRHQGKGPRWRKETIGEKVRYSKGWCSQTNSLKFNHKDKVGQSDYSEGTSFLPSVTQVSLSKFVP